MSEDRIIFYDEVHAALIKGSQKARKAIERSFPSKLEKISYLRGQFKLVADVVDHLLDNFDLDNDKIENREGFFDRKNDQKDIHELKPMLLAAFESVQYLEELEEVMNGMSPSLILDDKGLEAHIRLLKGVRVFQTNGKNDAYSLCAQRMIMEYRRESDLKPNPLRERHCA